MHIIVNPAARRARKTAETVTRALKEKGIPHTVEYTEKRGEAAVFAKKAAESGAPLVLCIGGDGTVSEVAAGLIHTKTALGIIPSGTGDDFAKCLHISRDPLNALNIAINGSRRMVDAGLANERVFVNIAGAGFDVEVLRQTQRHKRRYPGMLPYLLGVLGAIFHYPPMRVTIEQNGKKAEHAALLINIANGRFMGGGMTAAPHAVPDDGLFDVQYVDELARWKIPLLLAGFINGGYLKWKMAHHLRCGELTVTTSDHSLQLDGEVFEQKTVHYKILPKALTVMTPNEPS